MSFSFPKQNKMFGFVSPIHTVWDWQGGKQADRHGQKKLHFR